MESDTVRILGDNTLVDLWIEGKFRAITIGRAAIERYLQLTSDQAAAMSETDRREFVRTNLSLIVRAATARLHASPGADTIVIEGGQLGDPLDPPSGRRSGGDRRKGDPRQRNAGPPGGVERRGS